MRAGRRGASATLLPFPGKMACRGQVRMRHAPLATSCDGRRGWRREEWAPLPQLSFRLPIALYSSPALQLALPACRPSFSGTPGQPLGTPRCLPAIPSGAQPAWHAQLAPQSVDVSSFSLCGAMPYIFAPCCCLNLPALLPRPPFVLSRPSALLC